MTIMRADVLELKDNRINELISFANEVKAHAPKLGAQKFHLTRMVYGSQNADLCLFSAEWDSYEFHGAKFPDAVRNDAEWQSLIRRGLGPYSPAKHLRTQFGTKVAQIGPDIDVSAGECILVRFWEVKPGRLDEFIALAHEAAPYVEQHGSSTTLLRMTISGQTSGNIVSIAPFKDMATLGRYVDTIQSDPNAQKTWSKLNADDPPVRQLSMRVDTILL